MFPFMMPAIDSRSVRAFDTGDRVSRGGAPGVRSPALLLCLHGEVETAAVGRAVRSGCNPF